MYDSNAYRDYVNSEMEYRLGRVREDIVGRRRRRTIRELRNRIYDTVR